MKQARRALSRNAAAVAQTGGSAAKRAWNHPSDPGQRVAYAKLKMETWKDPADAPEAQSLNGIFRWDAGLIRGFRSILSREGFSTSRSPARASARSDTSDAAIIVSTVFIPLSPVTLTSLTGDVFQGDLK